MIIPSADIFPDRPNRNVKGVPGAASWDIRDAKPRAPGGDAPRKLRAERLVLPDYYIVLDPDAMPVTQKHWWLGVLAGAAPARVVPAGASASAVTEVLGRLAPGRWWPADLESWLRELPRVVPDRAGLPSMATGDGT